jgi:hypothetical protein
VAAYDDLNVRSIWLAGVIAILLTFLSVVGAQVIYYWMQENVENVRLLGSEYEQARESIRKQKEGMTGFQWIDKSQGKVAIPIDLAKDLIVRERQGAATEKPPAPANSDT